MNQQEMLMLLKEKRQVFILSILHEIYNIDLKNKPVSELLELSNVSCSLENELKQLLSTVKEAS